MHKSTYSILFVFLILVFILPNSHIVLGRQPTITLFCQPWDWLIEVGVLGEKRKSKELGPSGNSSEAPVWWRRGGVGNCPAKIVLLRHL